MTPEYVEGEYYKLNPKKKPKKTTLTKVSNEKEKQKVSQFEEKKAATKPQVKMTPEAEIQIFMKNYQSQMLELGKELSGGFLP